MAVRVPALVLLLLAAGLLSGCQDLVSIGYMNGCPFAVEVIDESLVEDFDEWPVVPSDSSAEFVTDSDRWKTIQLRVRRLGSDGAGTRLSVERFEALVPPEGDLDFVVVPVESICDQI